MVECRWFAASRPPFGAVAEHESGGRSNQRAAAAFLD